MTTRSSSGSCATRSTSTAPCSSSRRFATAAEIDALEEAVKAEIEEAVTFARESPYPDPSEVWEDMYADPIPLE